jgi:3-hydroxyanthranilate 3,4-dioxygenase
LKPPVSNKILFDGEQIKVMVVGGPNNRKDFHVEKGEELFYMLVGDMDLDIMENGERKRIHIAEGHFFLLPSCVPHSPQRYANTIGNQIFPFYESSFSSDIIALFITLFH